MEPRRRPEYNLEIFADAACVKDVVKGEYLFLLQTDLCFDHRRNFLPPPRASPTG
jgi:hypothetical protein